FNAEQCTTACGDGLPRVERRALWREAPYLFERAHVEHDGDGPQRRALRRWRRSFSQKTNCALIVCCGEIGWISPFNLWYTYFERALCLFPRKYRFNVTSSVCIGIWAGKS